MQNLDLLNQMKIQIKLTISRKKISKTCPTILVENLTNSKYTHKNIRKNKMRKINAKMCIKNGR